MPLFYSDKKLKATMLSAEQLRDGWPMEDVAKYWHLLGYDFFWVNHLMKSLLAQHVQAENWP
jgi:hypothetical protein